MKAKDIVTPADYEVKDHRGVRKAHIIKVEQRTETTYSSGGRRSVRGFETKVWRAVGTDDQGRETTFTLAQIVRPWAEAAPEHDALATFRGEGRQAADDLRAVLAKHGLTPNVSKGEGVHITVTFNRKAVRELVELLNQLPAE